MDINVKKAKKIIKSISESDVFKESMTHISFCKDNGSLRLKSYERLECLGDTILNYLSTDYIFQNFPEFNEGQISKLRQLMIQEKTLSLISRRLSLSDYILIGIGEKNNKGLEKDSILADVFESFLAALKKEKGLKQANNFLKITLFSWIKGKENEIWDYKTQLQEYCQSQKNSVIYKTINIKKEKDEFVFTVVVKDKLKTFLDKGEGRNKKTAEQNAALKVLKKKGLLNILNN